MTLTKKNKSNWSLFIKQKAYDLGFFYCGISKIEILEKEATYLEKWLSKNKNGEMKWMENNFEKRINPKKLVPDSKSIISLALNYFPKEIQKDKSAPKISKYAFGKDYHFVIKNKLKKLLELIHTSIGEVSGRFFVDSAPIMDKVWAKKSGVGWQGKNTNIINKKNGSFFFISELVLDIELEYDSPIKDYCGTCNRCIDACPTQALDKPYEIDSSKCISYFTIEYRDKLPMSLTKNIENWMFGCDICQDVCPWNKLSKQHKEILFTPHSKLLDMTKNDWIELTEDIYNEIFKKSAVKRTKYSGLKRNINFIFNNIN